MSESLKECKPQCKLRDLDFRRRDHCDRSFRLTVALRRGFGNRRALLHLMQVNRAHAQVLGGKLFIDSELCNVPGAMDVVRAQVEHYLPGIAGPGFNAIRSQLRAGLIPHD